MSSPQPEKTNSTPPVQNSLTAKWGEILNNWKVKTGLIAAVLFTAFLGVFLLVFFWQHWVAGMGMKSWSSHAGATPIECMLKDSNSDGYVSCSAMLTGEVVPLECGANIFNIGCRVNYGTAAAPPVRQSTLPSVRGGS
jgi:hypothetical protein